MSSREILISTASWEERFVKGTERLVAEHHFSSVLCFWFKEFDERTQEARRKFRDIVAPMEPHLVPLPMYATGEEGAPRKTPAYATVWVDIWKALENVGESCDSFVLDITTMPREALWITLDLLTEARIPGKIVYHRALAHGEWCGSEPEPPHIVPKLGGEPSLERPTSLMIVSGYDEDRSEQFIASFEPDETLIMFQDSSPTGTIDENRAKSDERHKKRFGNRGKAIKLRGVNCYTPDWGFALMMAAAREVGRNSNLILASLGPKTSAVSLYRVHCNLAESCLIYAPCRNYNPEYSEGIGVTYTLDWRPDQLMVKG